MRLDYDEDDKTLDKHDRMCEKFLASTILRHNIEDA